MVKPAGYGAGCNRARRRLSDGDSSVEQPLELVHLGVCKRAPARESTLVMQAGMQFALDEVNATIDDGVNYSANDASTRSRNIGAGSSGRPVDDAQRAIALRGLLPQALLDCLGDLEDALNAAELKLKWVERQGACAGVNEVATEGGFDDLGPRSRGAPSPSDGGDTLLAALGILVASVGEGKGKGLGKRPGKGGKGLQQHSQQGSPQKHFPPGVATPRKYLKGFWRCGSHSHRQSCPKYAAAVRKAGPGTPRPAAACVNWCPMLRPRVSRQLTKIAFFKLAGGWAATRQPGTSRRRGA
eukprot:2821306-Alexandrium_andersonii.AAC.1